MEIGDHDYVAQRDFDERGRGFSQSFKKRKSAPQTPTTATASTDTLTRERSERLPESSEEMEYKRFIFDSVCTHFHFQVFLEQFLAHIILPLAPLFTNLKGQGFAVWGIRPILLNILLPLIVYTMILTYWMSSTSDLSVLVGSVYMPMIFFLQHRLTIALKYATLSVSEYRKFMFCKDLRLCAMYTEQMQLLANWSSRQPQLIDFELGCAAVRIASRLNETHFILYDPTLGPSELNNMKHWRTFVAGRCDLYASSSKAATVESDVLSNPMTPTAATPCLDKYFKLRPDGTYAISVQDVCRSIVLHCDCPPKYRTFLFYCSVVHMFIHASIPFMLLSHRTIDATPTVIVFLICSTFLNLLMGLVTALLFSVVLIDAVRQVNMIQFLHALIRMTDLRLHLHLTMWSPRILHKSEAKYQDRDDEIARRNYELIRSLTRSQPLPTQRTTLTSPSTHLPHTSSAASSRLTPPLEDDAVSSTINMVLPHSSSDPVIANDSGMLVRRSISRLNSTSSGSSVRYGVGGRGVMQSRSQSEKRVGGTASNNTDTNNNNTSRPTTPPTVADTPMSIQPRLPPRMLPYPLERQASSMASRAIQGNSSTSGSGYYYYYGNTSPSPTNMGNANAASSVDNLQHMDAIRGSEGGGAAMAPLSRGSSRTSYSSNSTASKTTSPLHATTASAGVLMNASPTSSVYTNNNFNSYNQYNSIGSGGGHGRRLSKRRSTVLGEFNSTVGDQHSVSNISHNSDNDNSGSKDTNNIASNSEEENDDDHNNDDNAVQETNEDQIGTSPQSPVDNDRKAENNNTNDVSNSVPADVETGLRQGSPDMGGNVVPFVGIADASAVSSRTSSKKGVSYDIPRDRNNTTGSSNPADLSSTTPKSVKTNSSKNTNANAMNQNNNSGSNTKSGNKNTATNKGSIAAKSNMKKSDKNNNYNANNIHERRRTAYYHGHDSHDDALLANAYTSLPRLDLDIPENVAAWTYTRLAIQNFGERFRMRTEFYTMGNVLILVGLMASVLAIILTAHPVNHNNSNNNDANNSNNDDSNDHVAPFYSCFVIQASLAVGIGFLELILLAIALAIGNHELDLHNRTLSAHALRMRQEITKCKREKEEAEEEMEELVAQRQEVQWQLQQLQQHHHESLEHGPLDQQPGAPVQQSNRPHPLLHSSQTNNTNSNQSLDNLNLSEDDQPGDVPEDWLAEEDLLQDTIEQYLHTESQLQSRLHAIQNEIDLLSESVEGVHASMDIVELNTKLKPQKLLGFTADASVVFSLVTTGATFFLVLGSLYSSAVASAGSAVL